MTHISQPISSVLREHCHKIEHCLMLHVDYCSGVVRVSVTRGGNRGTLPQFSFDLFKMKNFEIFDLLHTQIKFIQSMSDSLLLAFYTKTFYLLHKISHLPFNHACYPQKLLFTILPTSKKNFLLVSPLEMVSPGAARPLRPHLSTPLLGCIL